MVRLLSLDDNRVLEHLARGEVGVLPTDTVYGLACSASNKYAVQRLYKLKHRESKPGTVIAAHVDQLVELGIPRRYLTAVENYWPNPISVVVPTTLEMRYLDLGKMSLAVRVPAGKAIRMLLEKSGPLLTSSANHPDEKPATNIDGAIGYFGESIDFYVDGGDLSDKQPSTIIRIIDDAVEVIRLGGMVVNEKGEIV